MTIAVARRMPAPSADEAAIRATVTDYYEGWYDGDAARMGRALHPALAKRGWIPGPNDRPELTEDTRDSMVEGTSRGVGRREGPDLRQFELGAIEAYGDIASATAYAVPYVDYLHLVRTDDGWRIVNALWCRP